jgi:hypothetical protein
MEDKLHIKELRISNFKGARSVTIYPTEVNEVAGENGSGKTSVLDAIVAALAGKRGIDPKPLTDGAVRGSVELVLGDLLVKRTFTEKGGGQLTVTRDGEKVPGGAQTTLDELVGEFSFDPLEFSCLSPAMQAAKLRDLAGPEWNLRLTELDACISTLELERLDVGRDIKKCGAIPALQPVEPVDIDALVTERAAIAAHNAQQDNLTEARARATGSIKQGQLDTQRLEAEIARLQDQFVSARIELGKSREALAQLPEPDYRDEDAVVQRLADAGKVNADAQAYAANETRRAELRALEKRHAQSEVDLQRARDQRTKHLRTAPLPVPGLDWSAIGVTLDGIPMQQVNFSRRLLLGAAIGRAIGGRFAACMIREHGGSIVGKTWDELLGWCREQGVQLWVETAGEGHTKDALVIEQGVLERYADDDL